MKYLLHFQCARCGHTWSVPCDSMSGALNSLGERGCPKTCGFGGQILLTGHDTAAELATRQALDLGLAAICCY